MSPRFSAEDDEILISSIRLHRAIYDLQHTDYKNVNIKERIWMEISANIRKSVEDCKKRWKSIRDNYFRHKKHQKVGTGSSAASKPVKWQLFEHLDFLNSTKHERSSTTTMTNEDTSGTDEEAASASETFTITSAPDDTILDCSNNSNSNNIRSRSNSRSRSRNSSTTAQALQDINKRSAERNNMLKCLMQEQDDTEIFMRSIALSVKKLPLHLKCRAKLEILTLVTNLELEAQRTNQPIQQTLVSENPAEPRQYTELNTLPQMTETYATESTSQDFSTYLRFN